MDLKKLMNANRVTIKELALFMGITQKRVRAVRNGCGINSLIEQDYQEAVAFLGKAKKDLPKPASCPGCSGSGVLTDDPQVLKCTSCGGIFTDPKQPICRTAAWKFVGLGQPMLANAGPDGSFYFDLDIVDGPDATQGTRVHGWADVKTRRVVQFG